MRAQRAPSDLGLQRNVYGGGDGDDDEEAGVKLADDEQLAAWTNRLGQERARRQEPRESAASGCKAVL